MTLYDVSPGAHRGFVRFFNSYATRGTMNKHDLRGMLFKYDINATNDELQKMIDSISVETTGISLQAFLDYCATWVGFRDMDQEYAECFRTFDRSGTGQLSKDDIVYVMGRLNHKLDNIDDIIKEYGTDKKVINIDGFIKMMKKL